jgi:hypothetical protein
MRCSACGGSAQGCSSCTFGAVKISQCPLEIIDYETIELVKFVELYRRGLPPVMGGVLDQAQLFLDAADFGFSEIDYWKNKNGTGS